MRRSLVPFDACRPLDRSASLPTLGGYLLVLWLSHSASPNSSRLRRQSRRRGSAAAPSGASAGSVREPRPATKRAASIPTGACRCRSGISRRARRSAWPAPRATYSGRTKTDLGLWVVGPRNDRCARAPGHWAPTSGLAASRPVSRVLYRGRSHGDDHPSVAAGCPTAQAADPRTGQRDLFRSDARFPARPNRVLLFGLAPSRVCRVSLPSPGKPESGLRLCGTGPRLTADGRYPLPCAEELGLSSGPTLAGS